MIEILIPQMGENPRTTKKRAIPAEISVVVAASKHTG